MAVAALVELPNQRGNRNARFTVNLTLHELVTFKAAAESEGRSVSNLCYQLIQAYLEQRDRSS